jgi:hypothetical protein
MTLLLYAHNLSCTTYSDVVPAGDYNMSLYIAEAGGLWVSVTVRRVTCQTGHVRCSYTLHRGSDITLALISLYSVTIPTLRTCYLI